MSDIDLEFTSETSAQKPAQAILVVEDDTADMVVLQKQVKALWPDCKIVPVKSLRAAQQAISEQNFDMVLLDLNLPDGFGPTSVTDVRKADGKVPIVVITGMVTNFTVDESYKLGANNVVPKAQITEEDFFNILEQNLET